MKKLIALLTILILSVSATHAHDEHEDSAFSISPSNFTLENGQPGESKKFTAHVDNDTDTDIFFDLKLIRLNTDGSEVSVDLTGDIMELEFKGLVDDKLLAPASSETPIKFTMSIDSEAPSGEFVYYLLLVEASEDPILNEELYFVYDIEIKDSTDSTKNSDFNFSSNLLPLPILGCILPLLLIGGIVMVTKKKTTSKGK